MHATCKKLDKTCNLLRALSARIATDGLLPIPYAGPGGGRFDNPPAPHVELTLLEEGGIDKARMGRTLAIDLPAGHLSIHNVHFGNHSKHVSGTRTLCLFLDIDNEAELAWIGRQPFACVLQPRNPFRLAQAIRLVNVRCLAVSATGGSYPNGAFGYDPARDCGAAEAEVLLLQAAVLEVLGLAWREAMAWRTGDDGGAGADPPAAVRLALETISARYTEPSLTLQDLARAARLSTDHFGRLFHRAVGVAPMAYLQNLRIERACHLFEKPGLRVGEAAEHVGFTDPYHFSRVFRARMGMSPRAYRLACAGKAVADA